MENINKISYKTAIQDFSMPRYKDIPNVGLYLEQTVNYVNDCLLPLHLSITPSMLSNYVKKGYISRPIKKQYYADQIAYLLFIIVAKQALPMEDVASLFELQKSTSSVSLAYNYFCRELEEVLKYIFEVNVKEPDIPSTSYSSIGAKAIRTVVIAVSHIIYLNYLFKDKINPIVKE